MAANTCVWLGTVLLVGSASAGDEQPDQQGPGRADPPVARTVLRMAHSDDGLEFTDLDRTFATGASAPDLTVLPDGDLLALFDHWIETEGSSQPVMAVSRSRDDGRTWSAMRLLRLRGPDGRRVRGWHGDLVEVADGRYRLYFATGKRPAGSPRPAQAGGRTAILSAVTHNGFEYRLDTRAGVAVSGRADLHPTAVRAGDRVHLYAACPEMRPASQDREATVQYAVSEDGGQFRERTLAGTLPVRFVGSLVPLERGLRAYVGSDEGIISLHSTDGREWKAEPGLRVAGGWDPAVARLQDGSFLMIYCVGQHNRPTTSPTRVEASSVAQSTGRASGGGTGRTGDLDAGAQTPAADASEGTEGMLAPPAGAVGEPQGAAVADVATEQPDGLPPGDGGPAARGASEGVEAGPDSLVAPLSDEELAWFDEDQDVVRADQDFDPDAIDPLLPDREAELAGGEADEWLDDDLGDWALEDELGFAPQPDWDNPVDYLDWFERNLLEEVEDGAYDAYAEFMPGSLRPSEMEVDWPELHHMFNDESYDGPPGPWDPADHPEWEASSQAAQEVLDRFREAGLKQDYGFRPLFGDEPMFDTPDGEPLLLEMLLPSLSPHRALVKATMADAWRAEDGQVSPERMLEAMETSLRNANHVSSGPTLIEGLVGMADRALVEKNARWALQHGVFDEHGLEETLDVLAEYDRDDTDPVRWTRGEHAMCMQTVQYMFDGDAAHRRQVAQTMASMMAEDMASQETLDEVLTLDHNDARIALDAFDDYYHEITEQMRTGYPEVRAADVDATVERYSDTNALTSLLIPSLSRVQVLRTRNEASRRATQLAYATHLIKARTGRWPGSLDELPAEFGQRMRTDPFSGDYFGYRLTEDGPTIYSASENALDDGGIHSDHWNDQITNEADSDDYVFWPPQDDKR